MTPTKCCLCAGEMGGTQKNPNHHDDCLEQLIAIQKTWTCPGCGKMRTILEINLLRIPYEKLCKEYAAYLKGRASVIAELKEAGVTDLIKPFIALLQSHNEIQKDIYPVMGINGALITVGDLKRLKTCSAKLKKIMGEL